MQNTLTEVKIAHRILVDYDQPLEKLIADGVYDQVIGGFSYRGYRLITNLIGKHEREIELVKVRNRGDGPTVREVGLALRQDGYRHATVQCLLTLASIVPEIPGDACVLALGSGWGNHLFSDPYGACVFMKDGKRSVRLFTWELVSAWPENSLFVLVREEK